MRLLTINDLMQRWQRSRSHVYELIARHGLESVKLDRRPLFREKDVERLETRLLGQ